MGCEGILFTHVEAVLVRRVIIGDGSCRWDGLEGMLDTGGGGPGVLVGVIKPAVVAGLSSAVI